MNDPESQDIDSDNQENHQGDDQEHIDFDSPVTLQHLTREMEWLS